MENTTRSGVFLTNFEVFHHKCVECLRLLLKQNDFRRKVKDAKMSSFFIWFPNTHLTLISFVFSLWIINEFEKKTSNKSHQRTLNKISTWWFFSAGISLGTLRSKDADGNENVKNNWFNKQNSNFARASRYFCTFLLCSCTTTTWKYLIWRFMEDVNKQRRNFISLSELGYGPLKFSFRRVHLHLTK